MASSFSSSSRPTSALLCADESAWDCFSSYGYSGLVPPPLPSSASGASGSLNHLPSGGGHGASGRHHRNNNNNNNTNVSNLLPTGIAPLDYARRAALQHLSTNHASFPSSSLNKRNIGASFHSADVVEIRGVKGAGKSHLAYEAVVNCILPAAVGGFESAVLFFDSDLQFRPLRIAEMARARLESFASESASPFDVKAELEAALERVAVYRPESSFQLLCTLHSIHLSQMTRARLLVIDTMLSHYYEDCLTEPPSGGLFASVPKALRSLVLDNQISVIGIVPKIYDGAHSRAEPRLASAWQDLVTLIVEMERNENPAGQHHQARFLMGKRASSSSSRRHHQRPVGTPKALFAAYGAPDRFQFRLGVAGVQWSYGNAR